MDDVELATVELLGALAYGHLRSFAAVACTISVAPDASTADALSDWAVREHAGYRRLRDHLATRTDLAAAVMDRQKPQFDAYFDRAPLDSWFHACLFFALGLPIAADFTRSVAPLVDSSAAAVLSDVMEVRTPLLHDAGRRLDALLREEGRREEARRITADLVGRALTGFQTAVAASTALKVLLAGGADDDVSGEQRVKQLAVAVMAGHHRRVIEFGLEEVEDVR